MKNLDTGPKLGNHPTHVPKYVLSDSKIALQPVPSMTIKFANVEEAPYARHNAEYSLFSPQPRPAQDRFYSTGIHSSAGSEDSYKWEASSPKVLAHMQPLSTIPSNTSQEHSTERSSKRPAMSRASTHANVDAAESSDYHLRAPLASPGLPTPVDLTIDNCINSCKLDDVQNGTIAKRATSVDARGAPLNLPNELPNASPELEDEMANANKLSVLVVDDDPLTRTLMTRVRVTAVRWCGMPETDAAWCSPTTDDYADYEGSGRGEHLNR